MVMRLKPTACPPPLLRSASPAPASTAMITRPATYSTASRTTYIASNPRNHFPIFSKNVLSAMAAPRMILGIKTPDQSTPLLDEHRRRDAEAFGQPLDLARIQVPLVRQHLGDHALAADLRQLRLPQAMLVHQELEHRDRAGGRDTRMLRLISLDEDAERIGKLGHGVFLVLPDLVEDRIQYPDCAGIVALGAQRTERHHRAQPAVLYCHLIHLTGCHDSLLPLILIVLGVSQHVPDIDFLTVVMDRGDEPVLVAAKVEHRELTDLIHRCKRSPEVRKRAEIRLGHDRVPRLQGLRRLPVPGGKLAQSLSCYDMH